MTALTIGVMAVWITSLVICAIVFWPILQRQRGRQRGQGAEEEAKPE
jgi:hypothetical protein